MTRETERSALVAKDRRYVWRPYTSSEDQERMEPFVVERAEGPWLFDMDGRRYLDGNASWWCSNLGHGHPRLRKALAEQLDRLMHCSLAGTTHEQATRLAEELSEVAPAGLERVFYSDNGSTAVEVALKMAIQYWRQVGEPERRLIVSLPSAYHGDTFGAMAVSGVELFRDTFGSMLFDVLRAPEPDDVGGFEGVIDHIENLLQVRGADVAAVIVEPLVQGAAGMRMWGPASLERLRKATHRANVLLIADEVFTGFGRTGAMWAVDHAGVAPDILCVSKGLSGGVMPFAATLATGRIFDGFRGGKERALMHGHTFCGNPLGARLAREVLAIYRDEDVVAGARAKGERIARAFDGLRSLEGVNHVRSLGMIGAADLGDGGYLGKTGWGVFEAARRRGAYLRPLGNTVYVCPPLTIEDDALDELLAIVRASIEEALARRA